MSVKGAFSRFYGLMAAVAGLISTSGLTHMAAVNKLGGYESRGHGKGKRSGKPVNRNRQTDWLHMAPHGGGKREVARRQRQLARGTLRTN